MAQDPLAPSPGSVAVATPVPVPSAPARDFKKIILRQTARKFTARPPPPRRPWPKPNYYCDYDSHESITSSLFSSDVVFSKSVVESLFFNTRYNQGSSTSSSTTSSCSSSYLVGTGGRYGVKSNGNPNAIENDDDDIQFVKHIKPRKPKSQGLNLLTSTTLAEAQAKSSFPKRSRPRPKSRPSTGTKKGKPKDPVSLIYTNTNADKTIIANTKLASARPSPKNKTGTNAPPKKRQRLSNNNETLTVNGHYSTNGEAKPKNVPALQVSQEGKNSTPEFPSHLWSLPTLAWTQVSTPTTAIMPIVVSAKTTESTPAHAQSACNGTPAGKKRPAHVVSPSRSGCRSKSSKSTCAIPRNQKKQPATSPHQSLHRSPNAKQPSATRKTYPGVKKIISSPLPNPVSVACPAKGSSPKNVSKKKQMQGTSKGYGFENVQSGETAKLNDKNNNTFSQLPPAIKGVPADRGLARSKTEDLGIKKPKQTKINGIFKLAKKSPTTSTAKSKSNKPSQRIKSTNVQTQTQVNGHGSRSHKLSPELKSKTGPREPAKSTSKQSTAISPSQACNSEPLPASDRAAHSPRIDHTPTKTQSGPGASRTQLPVFKDTRIMLVPQPITNEPPIDYSLKRLPPKQPQPTSDTSTEEPLNLKAGRQLRKTPTKSYMNLKLGSCPCACTGYH